MSDQTTNSTDRGQWPGVEYEPVDWTLPPELAGRVDIFQVRRLEGQPYQAAIPATISQRDVESALNPDIRRDAVEALAAIARFDEYVRGLPVSMPAVLLRTESASSSQIENLSASSRSIALAALKRKTRGNAALIEANGAAMSRAIRTGTQIDRETIVAIHRLLMENSDPDIVGRFRSRPVWIGTSAISPHGADFVPPRAPRVESAITDLAEFSRRHDVSALIRAAIVHAQFETIHPFEDGNGRTGRALVHTVLRASGFATDTIIPVSAGLVGNVRQYFDALTTYRAGDINAIVTVFTDAAQAAIVNGRHLATDLMDIQALWKQSLEARSDSIAWRLLGGLFTQPVVDAEYVVSEFGVSPQGALNALNALQKAGILVQSSGDRRGRVWHAPRVLDALDRFSERAGRRSL